MTHIKHFVLQVELRYNKHFDPEFKRRSSIIRPCTMFIVWSLNGVSYGSVQKFFTSYTENRVLKAIHRMEELRDIEEPQFMKLYSELLTLYYKVTLDLMNYVKSKKPKLLTV